MCPFSKKAFKTVLLELPKKLSEENRKNVSITIVQMPQPWHFPGLLLHETALVVKQLKPESYLRSCEKLFDQQSTLKDKATKDKKRGEIYDMIFGYLDNAAEIDRKKFDGKLEVSDDGTKVTPELKLHIKYARQNSIHSSPTFMINGIVDNSVSSSTSVDDWVKKINDLLGESSE